MKKYQEAKPTPMKDTTDSNPDVADDDVDLGDIDLDD
jgi:hypothetical protein